jgi:anti-sigma factor RsiW
MTGLTHEQARRCLNAAADKCLSPLHRAALEAHLAECPACRTYAEELNWLHVAIARALRYRWSPPERLAPSPVEMAARVRHRMWLDAERKFFLMFANAVVRLGSLAVVAMMVASLVTGNFLQANRPAPEIDSHAASGAIIGLPSFELEADNTALAGAASYSSSGEPWLLPAFPANRLRVSRY